MDRKIEERIRERAYVLWMQHGSLPGQADEYWYQAEREILGEGDQDSGTQAAPLIDPAPLGMTSMTTDETLSSPVTPKTRKKRSPAAAPVTEGGDTPTETPKRRRTTRVP
jgi:hypothetical protein